jgi:hypothetical protein
VTTHKEPTVQTISLLLLLSSFFEEPENAIYRVRTIRVLRNQDESYGRYSYLMQFDTHRGLNFLKPNAGQEDFGRLAACYHHRHGPVGQVMEKFNWFPGPQNSYWADSRLPASLAALGAATVGAGNLPAAQLVDLWTEPPVGVIGMYVGTMASYARPFQHMHFFEQNRDIISLSVPDRRKKAYFRYIEEAKKRGAMVKVVPGEERRALARDGAQAFYHALVVELYTKDLLEEISADLLTIEGMAVCFGKLAPDGILSIHTSNRYIDTVPVIADVAQKSGLFCKVARDSGGYQKGDRSHFASEWVMLARRPELLNFRTPPESGEELRWSVPAPNGRYVWSDKGRRSYYRLLRSEPSLVRLERTIMGHIRAAGSIATRLGLARDRFERSTYEPMALLEAFSAL